MRREEIYIRKISAELNLRTANFESAVEFLDVVATWPLISRYRKESTGRPKDLGDADELRRRAPKRR